MNESSYHFDTTAKPKNYKRQDEEVSIREEGLRANVLVNVVIDGRRSFCFCEPSTGALCRTSQDETSDISIRRIGYRIVATSSLNDEVEEKGYD